MLEEIRKIEEFQRDHQRKPPSLKVLSAMAICKKFRDSEEIRSLESSAGHISWSGFCDEECEPFSLPTCEYGRLQAEDMLKFGMIEKLEDWHCGFCRYSSIRSHTPLRLEVNRSQWCTTPKIILLWIGLNPNPW